MVSALALGPVAVTAIPAGADALAQRSNVVACSVERLPVPDDVRSAGVRAADPTGSYLTGTAYLNGAGHRHPLLWHNGKVFDLGVPRTWYDAEPRDVNDAGIVVGTSGPSTNRVAWMHAKGEYTTLAAPEEADEVVPQAINAQGVIVGHGRDIDTDPDTIRPLIWSADEPDTYRELNASDSAWATGISDDGVIMGKVSGAGAHVWTSVSSDATPLATHGQDDSRGTDLSGDWAVGWTADGDTSAKTWVTWDLEEGTVHDKGDGPLSAVNVEGDVIDLSEPTPMVIRSDDDETVAELPALDDGERAMARTLFDPGAAYTAAGESGHDEGGGVLPVRWTGC